MSIFTIPSISSNVDATEMSVSVCQHVSLGIDTYRPNSPPSTPSTREFAKQLVAMVAVFRAPISSHFSWGPEGGTPALSGKEQQYEGRLAYIQPRTVNPCTNIPA